MPFPITPNAAYITITGTATITGTEAVVPDGIRGVYIVMDVTTITGTAPTITPAYQIKDQVSGKFVQIHANLTAVGATGTTTYLLYPNAPAAAGGITATAGFPVGGIARVVLTYGGTVTATAGTVALHWLG